MKRCERWLALGMLSVLSATVAPAAPTGWTYIQYPFAYCMDQGTWYYLSEDYPVLTYCYQAMQWQWLGTPRASGTSPGTGAVPKTWQTTSYSPHDDAWYHKGLAWPNPRFTVGTGNASKCVTDNLTGLMWVKNPDAVKRDWYAAIDYCEALDGSGGRGGYTDWRLPNVKELTSLVDYENCNPALPDPHPFEGIVNWCYWTSTSLAGHPNQAFWVYIKYGAVGTVDDKTVDYEWSYVWAVRGGQD